MYDACCLLLGLGCVVRLSLRVRDYAMRVVWCSLLISCCLYVLDFCVLMVGYSSVCVTGWLLFVGCRLLFDG